MFKLDVFLIFCSVVYGVVCDSGSGQNASAKPEESFPRRWKNAIIPYNISGSFTDAQKNLIMEALQDIMAKTCIQFIPRVEQEDYIYFLSSFGCYSYVGRYGSKQPIALNPGCMEKIGGIQHQVLHALGSFHEHNRADRDDYVTINWSNILSGHKASFHKYNFDLMNSTYDFESIMHFGANDFAKDPSKPTLISKNESLGIKMGNQTVMSQMDVDKINRFYNCPSYDGPTIVKHRQRTVN